MKKSAVVIFFFSFFVALNAMSLKDSVVKTLKTNPNIIAEKTNQDAYKRYIDEKERKYLPTLDLNAYLEKSRTKDHFDDGRRTDGREDGYNAALVLRQLIYDGGLTPSEIEEMTHRDLSNRFRSLNAIENTILETSKAYVNLARINEQLVLTKDNIKTNEDNLIIAKEKEDISGEVLETYQVQSKLYFAKDKLIEEQTSKDVQTHALKKYVGVDITSKVCRPVIDETVFPETAKEAIKEAILENYEIKKQVEEIKAQREKIAQSDSTFLPTLRLELKTSIDDDLELNENGTEYQSYARLTFDWNLYNGGRDKNKSQQEEIFLKEQKKSLDEITNKIVKDVKDKYKEYFNNKRRVEMLKNYVKANANIVNVYKSEFEAGTRTFVDILNAENELYQSTQSLVRKEYDLYDNYFDLLYSMSKLTKTILKQENQDCAKVAPVVYKVEPDKKKAEFTDELKDLLDEEDSEIIQEEMKTE